MNRPALVALGACALLAAAILLWPPAERESVSEGLLPASARPLVKADPGLEEPSAAARQVSFSPPGPALDPAATGLAPVEQPPPPVADRLPVLVGVVGGPDALTGYFSSNGRSFRARRGEFVDGWRVTALGRRDARLVKGGRRRDVSLFSPRDGVISPAMARVERPVAAAPVDPGQASKAAAPIAGPPRAPRKPVPPPPRGSKGYWSGPPGSMPPGYVPYPKTD